MKYVIKEEYSPILERRVFRAYTSGGSVLSHTTGDTIEECETKLRAWLNSENDNAPKIVKELEIP